jgi:hypothetical protein
VPREERRRARVGRIACLLWAAWLARGETVAGSAPAGATEPVIVAGQDAAIAAMLGQGTILPGDCRLAGGGIDRGIVTARYACATGPVAIELRHASAAPAAVVRTERFAILPRSGDLPDGFVAGLATVVRDREAAVVWRDVGVHADADHVWRCALRVNVWIFLASASATLVGATWALRRHGATMDAGVVLASTALAAVLRFALASPNLMDFGGIPYSRWLRGYKGYLGAAELFAVVAPATMRDLEHAIALNRLAGTLTVPLVHLLCRRLLPGARLWPALAALLVAVSPLHVAFSASDALAVVSGFLAVASWVLLTEALQRDRGALRTTIAAFGAFGGLALSTQVRYENALLLVPAALFVLQRWRAVRWRHVGPPLAFAAGLLALYAHQTATFGLSYTNTVQPENVGAAVRHLVTSPFVAAPLLMIGTAAAVAGAPRSIAVAAVLPWLVALTLATSSQSDAHGFARVFATWLVLILPVAAYGFTAMLRAPSRPLHVVAAAVLLVLIAQPFLVRDRLASRHLEIVEHDRFRALVAHLPSGVTTLVVPDDELFRRRHGATFEVLRKYAMIADGGPPLGARPRLVGVTEALEHPERAGCDPGACAFFFGLPCFEQDVYSYTADQCRELLRRHRTSVVDAASVRAAPFARCSIYAGRLHDEVCAPAIRERTFTLYRIDGARP